MPVQVLFPKSPIADLFGEAWNSGCLTSTHRINLKTALLETTLTEDDRAAIDRLIHAVRRGWLKIID